MLQAIIYNLGKLTRFSGRQMRGQFWPYAGFIFGLSMAGMMMVMLSEIAPVLQKMQAFAAAHPELATVEQGPGTYSISIQGNHPELMPDMGGMMGMMDVVLVILVALMAAAVTRRLHDCGKSGAWGLLPLPFIAFASVVMPKIFTQPAANFWLFFPLFINNMLYIGALIFLVVLLARTGTQGENRYGPAPTVNR